MAKLTKQQAARHLEACDLLKKDTLTEDDRWFVLEHWQESANHINSVAGAFFTPLGLARSFTIEAHGHRIIDLCAGIGTLAFMVRAMRCYGQAPEIVCVELNPAYVEVGRKVLPEAQWICADVFSLDVAQVGRFDQAISNPPFGKVARKTCAAPRYTGGKFEYHVVDIASGVADYGTFILPQESAPFRYSGRQRFEPVSSSAYQRFSQQTGIELTNNCGIDTSEHQSEWRGVAPAVEIVLSDFTEARQRRAPAEPDLFAPAA